MHSYHFAVSRPVFFILWSLCIDYITCAWNNTTFSPVSDASGIDFRAMLKKKQHAKQNDEPEPETPELKPVDEPVVELKKVEKVGVDVSGRISPSCIEIKPQSFNSK